jgi:uncharacterized protein
MEKSTFLTEFLQLSDYRTYLFLAVLLMVFYCIRKTEKKKIKFSYRMIIGSVVGLVLGVVIQMIARFPSEPSEVVWLSEVSSWYGLVGNGFMDLLKMLVVPLIFFSIVRVIMNMQGDNLGKLTYRTIGMLVGTTLIASVIGAVLGTVFQLGSSLVIGEADAQIREMVPIVETLRGLLPSNVVQSMSEGNIVAVVIFAGFIGIAIRRLNKKYQDIIEPFTKWVEAFYKIILSVAMTIIKFMPYAVVALLSNTIISRGISVLASVLQYILVLYLGIICMFIVHLIIAAIQGVKPSAYIKNGLEPLLLAFTSRSSLGTLPVLIETLHTKFAVDEGIASFVGSLGANMGMNGCAGLYSAMTTVMLAQMVGVDMNLSFFLMLAIIIAVSSFGIAGIPGAATISMSVVISGMGLGAYFPLVGAIVAIDPILDMGRTFLNVSGTMVSAITVDKSIGKGK